MSGIEAIITECSLLESDSIRLWECPNYAPKGYIGMSEGQSVFPLIGPDGKLSSSAAFYLTDGKQILAKEVDLKSSQESIRSLVAAAFQEASDSFAH